MVWPFKRKAKPAPAKTAAPKEAPKGLPKGVPVGSVANAAIGKTIKPEEKPLKLVEDIESDPKFLLGRQVVEALICATQVSIEVGGSFANDKEERRAKRLAANLEERWRAMLPHACEAFGYGRAAFEKTYRCERGLALVDSLDYLEPDSTDMELTDEGAFAGITLTVKKGKDKDSKDESVTLEPARCWWFALDPTASIPYGRSRYLGAPVKVWEQRSKLAAQWDVYLDRFANGQFVGKAPAAYPADSMNGDGERGEIDRNGANVNPIDDLRSAYEQSQSGGLIITPSGNHTDGSNAPLFELNGLAIQPDVTAMIARQNKLDDDALESVGIPPRAVTQNAETGTQAMAKVHLSVLLNTVDGVEGQLIASFQRYVIDPTVAINWPAGARPKFKLVSQRLSDETVALVTTLVTGVLAAPQASPLITEGVVDIVKLLGIVKLPVGSDLAAKLVEVKERARQMATPAPAAPGGGGFGLQLARKPQADDQVWEEFAKQAGREAAEIWAHIHAAMADPEAAERAVDNSESAAARRL